MCCTIKPTEYILSTVSFQWTKNFHHKSLYLQMGTCSPVRRLHGKALDQYNFMGPFMFYYSLLYWMNAPPRATHLFRQSSKPKVYADPDVKCFQSFVSSPHIFEAILPQCLLYERYANLKCSKIHYSSAFPNCSILYLQTSRKKNYNLIQNYSVGSDLTKHNRWLQKTISHYYYVSDFN